MTIKENLIKIGAWPFIRVNSKGEVVVDMEKYVEQIKQEAYEEAANICDKMKEKAYEDGEGSTDIPAWINNCSNIIRALKTKP